MIRKIIASLIIFCILYFIAAHFRAYMWKVKAEKYSISVLKKISSPWSVAALIDNSSASLKGAGESRLENIIQKYSEYAGNYKNNSQENSECILVTKPDEASNNIYAQCTVIAEFEKRELVIDMRLNLDKDNWKINDLRLKEG